MEPDKNYSLSYFLNQQTKEIATTGFSATDMLAVLKALKSKDKHTAKLTALARAAKLKIAACQQICEVLAQDGLVTIEPDNETGNDTVTLTEKGVESL